MTDDLTALLTASRPPVDEAALLEVSVALARETVRTSRVAARARRRRRLVGVVAAVAVAVPATAAATYWSAHTGEHGDRSLTEENASVARRLRARLRRGGRRPGAHRPGPPGGRELGDGNRPRRRQRDLGLRPGAVAHAGRRGPAVLRALRRLRLGRGLAARRRPR